MSGGRWAKRRLAFDFLRRHGSSRIARVDVDAAACRRRGVCCRTCRNRTGGSKGETSSRPVGSSCRADVSQARPPSSATGSTERVLRVRRSPMVMGPAALRVSRGVAGVLRRHAGWAVLRRGSTIESGELRANRASGSTIWTSAVSLSVRAIAGVCEALGATVERVDERSHPRGSR
jgi:hypothetical protein